MGAESVHLRELAEVIGPRPTGTPAEERASAYIRSVMSSRQLEVTDQQFFAPKTQAWAFVTCHLLTILAAVLARFSPVAAALVGLLAAVLLWLEYEDKGLVSSVWPKAPSQNVIGRHIPKLRRGEVVRRIVLVAHYDTAKPSLFYSPGLVRRGRLIATITKAASWLVPVFALAAVLDAVTQMQPWWWYATMVLAAWLLLPLLAHLHSELLTKPVTGANDNASGVAALLGVIERVVPESETPPEAPATRATEQVEWASDVLPADEAAPARTPSPALEIEDDIDWTTGPIPVRQQRIDWAEEGPRGRRPSQPEREAEPESGAEAERPEPDVWREPGRDRPHFEGGDWGEEALEGWQEAPQPRSTPAYRDQPIEPGAPGANEEPGESIGGWLGVENDFDVRSKGREIGSWEHIEDDDDDSGFKAGAAPDELDDPEFAASEAARIRRKVTSSMDHDLAEKELWFVATGAAESGGWGMRSLISEFGEELGDAVILNIISVGGGTLCWATAEGLGRRRTASRRLANAARTLAREQEISTRECAPDMLVTDATTALARGYKAMSLLSLDINGRVPNRHQATDTTENVSVEAVEKATDFVTDLVKGL